MFNTLKPRQNGRHFADDILKCIFLNENVWISLKILLKFVPKGPIKNIPALVQIMAQCRPGDKPLSEPMMVTLLMHICVTRPQWVKLDQSVVGYTPMVVKFMSHKAIFLWSQNTAPYCDDVSQCAMWLPCLLWNSPVIYYFCHKPC